MNGLINDDEYALKVAIICKDKVVFDVNDKPCALTTRAFLS